MRQGRALQDLESDERVLLVARRHPLSLLRTLLPPLILLVVLCIVAAILLALGLSALAPVIGGVLVLGLPWLIWVWADWRADFLALTTRRVLWVQRTPFLRERRWEAPLSNIQNVAAISGGPIEHLCRCADLVLDTTSRGVVRLHSLRRAAVAAGAIVDAQGYSARSATRLRRLRTELGLEPEQAATAAERPGVRVWRRHLWLLVRSLVLPTALLAVSALLASLLDLRIILLVASTVVLLWGVWIVDDWRNDEIVATSDRILQTSRRPLTLHEETWQASLDKVQDVSYSIPNPLAQLLDYGTVTVKTAGDGIDFEMAGLPNPRAISAELNHRLQMRRGHKERAFLREVEQTVHAVLRARGL